MFLLAGAAALAAAACGNSGMDADVVQPFDSGGSRDIVTMHDSNTTPTDTSVMCDFVPNGGVQMCRVLMQVCTTGPISCDGGMSFANITCQCRTVQLMNQVWQCDNVCGAPSADASTGD
jgi:hypothetical protein